MEAANGKVLYKRVALRIAFTHALKTLSRRGARLRVLVFLLRLTPLVDYVSYIVFVFSCVFRSSLLETKTVVPQDMVRHLTACLVLGLETLHSCDVLYRALSPELVFLDSRYVVYDLRVYDGKMCFLLE